MSNITKYLVRAEIELDADSPEMAKATIEENLRGKTSLVMLDGVVDLDEEYKD